MEEYIEVSAKTKEEAIMNAAIQLGTSTFFDPSLTFARFLSFWWRKYNALF